ncbi:MAG: hypothetical protein EOP84_02315 [Verrucomicrobiaceae bacterium]|nr:MAG: hypothetical protein EOP84_02315 [Verrucomicrobiaceae bacterium]
MRSRTAVPRIAFFCCALAFSALGHAGVQAGYMWRDRSALIYLRFVPDNGRFAVTMTSVSRDLAKDSGTTSFSAELVARASGSAVTIEFERGLSLFGTSTYRLSGQVSGRSLVLSIPQKTGAIQKVSLTSASIETWNHAVEAFGHQQLVNKACVDFRQAYASYVDRFNRESARVSDALQAAKAEIAELKRRIPEEDAALSRATVELAEQTTKVESATQDEEIAAAALRDARDEAKRLRTDEARDKYDRAAEAYDEAKDRRSSASDARDVFQERLGAAEQRLADSRRNLELISGRVLQFERRLDLARAASAVLNAPKARTSYAELSQGKFRSAIAYAGTKLYGGPSSNNATFDVLPENYRVLILPVGSGWSVCMARDKEVVWVQTTGLRNLALLRSDLIRS